MKKKIVSVLLTAVMLFCFTMTFNAQQPIVKAALKTNLYDFSQFRGNTMAQGIVDSKTPLTAQTTKENWSTAFGSDWSSTPGTPIIVGDNLYVIVPGQKKLYRVNKNTGAILQSVDSPGDSQFFSIIGYGDGTIFVPRQVKIDGKSCVVVQAYDEKTMNPLWQTCPIGNPQDSLSPYSGITYYNGYVYIGASNGSGDKGAYACFNTKDEDVKNPNEVKNPVWEYAPQAPARAGFYWSGGAIVNNAIVFGGEATELVIHSLTTNEVYDKIVLEQNTKSGIRSTVHYDSQTNRLFAATKAGSVYSVKINGDNTFDKTSLISKSIGTDITSSPVVYNSRVYIGGGGAGSKSEFFVLNALTLDKIYSIPEIKTQSSPIITTAYATEQNDWEVNIYVVKFDKSNPDPSCLFRITDSQTQTTANFEAIAVPSKLNYCSQSVSIDADGSIYFYNDSGKIFSFGNKAEASGVYTSANVESAIEYYENAAQIVGTDLFTLSRILSRYNGLSSDEQAKVKNVAELEKMINLAKQQSDQSFIIGELNENLLTLDVDALTIEHEEYITSLCVKYNLLTQQNKTLVINAAVLDKAVAKMIAFKEEKAIKTLNLQIKQLPSIDELCLDDTKKVNEVLNFFALQSDNVKDKVDKTTLIALQTKLEEIKKVVDEINSKIFNELDPMNITLSDEQTVEEIMRTYAKLNVKDQKYVEGYDEVVVAKAQIDKLKQNASIKPNAPQTTDKASVVLTLIILSVIALIGKASRKAIKKIV